MGLLYLVAFLDRVNVGFAALTMNVDLKFSPVVFGTGAGIFFIGYVLLGVPSNLMLHRFGARRWISGIMIFWGVISGAMAFIRSASDFYALRFLLGVAEAGFFPGMILYVTYWFPKSQRARILGAFMAALPLSSVIGAPISATLLDLNVYGFRGWQWLFLLEGIPAVIAGVISLKYLSDRPEQATWLTGPERAVLIENLQGSGPADQPSNARGALTHSGVWTLSAVYFALLVALYGYTFWLPQILHALGPFSYRQIGVLAMLPNIAAAPLMYAWGRHSDANSERRWHVALSLIIGGMGLSMAAWVHEPTFSLIALTVGAVGIYCALPVFWALPCNHLSGAFAAVGIAVINAVGNVGGYVGSSMMGYMKQASGGYTRGLAAFAAALVIAALLVISVEQSAL
jgi:ACS family tartrate transporter-like MFS transporter